MPCYEEREILLDLNLADQETLKEALKELGWSSLYRNGKIVASGDESAEEIIATVKKKYAEKLVQKIAKRKGWQTSKNGNRITIRR